MRRADGRGDCGRVEKFGKYEGVRSRSCTGDEVGCGAVRCGRLGERKERLRGDMSVSRASTRNLP